MSAIDLPGDHTADRQSTLPPPTLPVTDAQLHLRLPSHPALAHPAHPPLSAYTALLNACLDPSLHSRSISLTPQPAELAATAEPTPSSASAPPTCSDSAHRLGEHALEHCVPPVESRPPRSLPKPGAESALHSVRQPHRVPAPTNLVTVARHAPWPAKPSVLAQITPWRTFTPLPDAQLYTLPPRAPADAHRRGFWFIPVWKRHIGPDDFFATFAHAVSLSYWAQPSLSQSEPALEGYAIPPVHWTPARLRAFWKIISHICTRGTIGNISAVAVMSSHAQDILPVHSPSPTTARPISAAEDQFGDHIRVWSDLDSALQLRRLFSDLSLSLVPSDTSDDAKPVSEEESKFKWLRKCVFMWFDDAGLPRGYG